MSIRRRTVGWMTALLAASIPGWSTPVSLAEEPERLATMVDRVTIYPDLVSLQRAASLEISAAGTRLVGVVIPGADGVDRDSVRVTARGAGTVTSVDLIEIEGRVCWHGCSGVLCEPYLTTLKSQLGVHRRTGHGAPRVAIA